MTTYSYNISNQKVECIFDATINQLDNYATANAVVIITDHHIAALYSQQLSAYRVITFVAGESNKTQATVDQIIQQLILMEIDREALIVGVGGGVVTDIVGFVASIYKRGLRFVFIPTTILAMVDAAIGGKNGVNVGLYKNMVGTIVQPSFILFDYTFLQTLPEAEWRNGFVEIIKHACIRDAEMFSKEVYFSAMKMSTRLSAKQEIHYSMDETDSERPAFLRKKAEEGKDISERKLNLKKKNYPTFQENHVINNQ